MPWWMGVAWAGSTWFVPDTERAAQIRAAIESEWPGDGIVIVVVGIPGDGEPGFRWTGDLLVSRGADQTTRSAPATDPADVVLLARTWSVDAGDEPPPPAPEPPPACETPAIPEASNADLVALRPTPWKPVVAVGARIGFAEPTDGIRLSGGGERNGLEIDLIAGLTIGAYGQQEQADLARHGDREGSHLVAGDRWTLGVALHRIEPVGRVPVRLGLGGELRDAMATRVVHHYQQPIWQSFDTIAEGPALDAIGDVGVAIGGRVRVLPALYARASTAAPMGEAGLTVDLAVGPRPTTR